MSYTISSPLGPIELTLGERGISELRFGAGPAKTDAVPKEITSALEAYFAGDLTAIDALEVDPEGSEFQHQVWRELRKIPAGQTTSYAALAAKIGRPTAARAVARANATNPIALIVPCHRVIGSDGQLRGYAYGLETKRWLLDHERR